MFLSKLSISKKITGSMSIILLIMLSIMVISFFEIEKTDAKLKIMTNYVIPISHSINSMRMLSLEQEVLVERILHKKDEVHISAFENRIV